MSHASPSADFGVLDVTVEVKIDAPASRVWTALVEETSSWWHKDFYTGKEAKGFVIEPRLGGHAFEDWGDGQGMVWFTVIGVERERMLLLVGDSSRDWGGPAREILQLSLAEEAGVTTLRLVQDTFGKTNEAAGKSLDEGWQMLFGECFKSWVESAARPGAAASSH